MSELQIWQAISFVALVLLAGALLLLFVVMRRTSIHYRHLSGSERVYLYGDGIAPGWYRLERPQVGEVAP